MYNWSVDEKKFKKDNPKKYRLWRLEQLVNYGLGGEKLSLKAVKKNWQVLAKRIDPRTKTYFEFLLWGKRPSSRQSSVNFWNLS